MLRFTVAGYHESLLSLTYPGDRHGYEYFKPALGTLIKEMGWSREQRGQVIVRSDAEQGTTADLSYVLWQGLQVLMKGYSGRRTQAWVRRTAEAQWHADPQRAQRWAAPAPEQLRLGRRLDGYLLRWVDTRQQLTHATLFSTLALPVFSLWNLYDGRGATEVEIRADKSGLGLQRRRKHSLDAQAGWVLLTDVAHNLIAWLRGWMLAGSDLETFGPQRIVADLFTIPGRVSFKGGRLHKVGLWQSHPYASEMRFCLHQLLSTFDLG